MIENIIWRIRQSDPIVPMLYVGFMTFLTGIVLALPTQTLTTAKGLKFLLDHGGEGIWAWVFTLIGLLLIGHCIRELTSQRIIRRWEIRLGNVLWQITSPFWIFIGTSFLINNPGSLGTVVYVLSGGLAWWIARQLLRRSWEK
jgi:hypothetical protein